jgi:hypothetical protein
MGQRNVVKDKLGIEDLEIGSGTTTVATSTGGTRTINRINPANLQAVEVFNVQDQQYGATGDGSTDDLAAINLAIAALIAAGAGILYFPAGSYKVTEGLDPITIDGAVVLGESPLTSQLLADGAAMTQPIIAFTGTSGNPLTNCAIRNIAVNGAARAATCDAFELTWCQQMQVENVTAFNCDGYGLDCQAVSESRFLGVRLDRCGNVAGTKPSLRGLATDTGDDTTGTRNNLFIGCEVTQNYWKGAVIEDECDRNTFSACFFRGAESIGGGPFAYALFETDDTVDLVITGCQFYGNTAADAIVIGTSASRFSILGNIISESVHGVTINSATLGIVDGNQFHSNSTAHINTDNADSTTSFGVANQFQGSVPIFTDATNVDLVDVYSGIQVATQRSGTAAVFAAYQDTGTGAAADTLRFQFIQDNASSLVNTSAIIDVVLVDATNASEDARIAFWAELGGTMTEQLRIQDGALWIKDGVTAPVAAVGFAQIYVDTADGDLKVRFGDGTTTVIAADT